MTATAGRGLDAAFRPKRKVEYTEVLCVHSSLLMLTPESGTSLPYGRLGSRVWVQSYTHHSLTGLQGKCCFRKYRR